MATRTKKKTASKPSVSTKKLNGSNGKSTIAAKVLDTTARPESVVAQAIAQEEFHDNVGTENQKVGIAKAKKKLTHDDLTRINTRDGLVQLLRKRKIKMNKVTEILQYEEELALLQIELVKLQHWIDQTQKRVAIILEGRDAAGKGGTIRRFTEHLNPRSLRVVALPKPTETERGQWYFQRYTNQLPNPGELVFFDRSWYNRAVVEPVMGFCSDEQYETFMLQVPEYEHMLYEDGVVLIKFWFSISKKEQNRRFASRRENPLKQWKLSPVDQKAQDMWDRYTTFKEKMFSRTHTSYAPWIVVKANSKRTARLEAIRYVLSLLPYDGKEDSATRVGPDPNIITRFHRKSRTID